MDSKKFEDGAIKVEKFGEKVGSFIRNISITIGWKTISIVLFVIFSTIGLFVGMINGIILKNKKEVMWNL